MIKTSLARSCKRFIVLFLAAMVLANATASLLFVNTASAEDPHDYTLYYPDTDEFKSKLRAAHRDGGSIGESDLNDVFSKTRMMTKGGRLGTAALALDTEKTNKNDIPTYRLDYYCTPSDGYKLSTDIPSANVPYIRYTLGVTIMDNNNWEGILDQSEYDTYVGMVGDTEVGTVHFPELIDAGSGGWPSKDFGLLGEGGEHDIRTGLAQYNYYDDGHTYNFKDYAPSLPDNEEVFKRCMPNPRGDRGKATSNFNKLSNADQNDWNRATRDAGLGDDVAGTGANPDDPGSSQPGCEETFSSAISWIVCPISDTINTMVEELDSTINRLLEVDTNNVFAKNSGDPDNPSPHYYEAWNSFRIIALGLIFIVALIIIISSALGFEIFDAYTIRKTLPRLILAILFITLSWSVLEFLITLTNDVGMGVRSLIYAPFEGFKGEGVDNAIGIVAVTLVGVGLKALGPMGLLSFGITALLAALIALTILVLREMIIIFLIIIAPVAIAAMILPNTRKAWDFWRSTLITMLVVFPIIAGMIALGRVFSVVAYTGNPDNIFQVTISFIAYFLPYFLLPFAFRLAGGVIGTLAGLGNDRSRGGFDRLKKYRQGEWGTHGGRKVENVNRRMMGRRADMQNRLLQSASKDRGGRIRNFAARRALTGLAGQVGGYNLEAGMSAKRGEVAKEINDQIATGRDEEIRGLTVNKNWASRQGALQDIGNGVRSNGWMRIDKDGQRQYKTLGGAWVDEGYVDRGFQRWGNDSFAQQAALSYEMRKALTEDDSQGLATNYRNVAQAWGMSDNSAAGAWIGAAFENQNQHLEYKYTDWQTGELTPQKAAGFTKEIYEKKGSFEMGRMHANTFEQLKNAHDVARANGDTDTMRRVQAIAETFVSRGGGGQGGVMDDGEGNLIPIPGGGRPAGYGPAVQTNAQGAAHVAEQVRDLAAHVGVYTTQKIPNAAHNANAPSALPPDHPDQH